MDTTWHIDTDTQTIKNITGRWGVVFRLWESNSTSITGGARIESGTDFVFRLDRISGELTVTVIDKDKNGAALYPSIAYSKCRSMNKPII
jgi:hypothetical protein